MNQSNFSKLKRPIIKVEVHHQEKIFNVGFNTIDSAFNVHLCDKL